MARSPNLLLTFDAFGTLFRPKGPIAQQYGQVARRLGLANLRDDHVHAAMLKAITAQTKRHPNYGKATGLGATEWWTNVIHETFTPLLKEGERLPADLAPSLIRRFSSREGYSTEPHLLSSLRAVKRQDPCSPSPSRPFRKLVVGVVTNSDDRVPRILASLGLDVSPLRYGSPVGEQDEEEEAAGAHDIDFHCMSYDVGSEKPDARIFRAAEAMLARVLDGREDGAGDAQAWRRVHVGDEYGKDVVGALGAGWSAVLLDEAGEGPGLPWLEECAGSAATLETLFGDRGAVRVRSLASLMSWLGGSVDVR